MSNKKQLHPTEPDSVAVSNGVDLVLDSKALSCLAGYFDVLIQMDFVQKQSNKQRSKDEKKNLPDH